jgi:hypothetical protein
MSHVDESRSQHRPTKLRRTGTIPRLFYCFHFLAQRDEFPIVPPIIVKDTPKPRRFTTVEEARDYVDEAMRLGRPAPWREVWHRLKTVTSEDGAIEAIGDLRELLVEEDLLLPDDETR